MTDIEGVICDECGTRIGPHGCCADARWRERQLRTRRGSGVILAVVGSTSLDHRCAEAVEIITEAIQRLKPERMVSGGADGIDTLAKRLARGASIPFTTHEPGVQAWRKGMPDGFEARNLLVAADCTHLLRIVASLTKTYGSGWTRDRAKDMGALTWEHVINVNVQAAPAGDKARRLAEHLIDREEDGL